MLHNKKYYPVSAMAGRATLVVSLFAVLAGCAFSSADKTRKFDYVDPTEATITRSGERLTDLNHRLTDGQIRSDLRTIDALQARIARLNDNGHPIDSYGICKAQAWLDFGRDEYSENDRSGVSNAALRESLLEIRALEQGDKSMRPTRLIETTVMLREDLWKLAASMRASNASCADCTLAKFEVALVWAGHEQPELGWRHAEPYIRHAEDLARMAEKEIEACNKPMAPAPASCQTMCPINAPAQAPRLVPNNIHFALDEYSISPVSAMILNRLAKIMLERTDMEVMLTGHTDQTFSDRYNRQLAQRRAEATLQYLQNRGVPKKRVSTASAGETELASKGCSPQAHAINRRVEVTIYGGGNLERTEQMDDLQPSLGQTRCTK